MLSIYSAVSETTGETYHLTIDQSRDTLLSEASHVLLKEGKYMLPEETSPQEAFARASIAFGSNQDHAQRLYDAVSRLWFMYASPVLSNAGNPRGLPASCNLAYMGDSREEIADTWKEMLFLATLGAGVGLNMSALRSVGTGNSRGTSTPGLIPFMKVIDSITMASKQGEVRRGATAVYLDIGHPEFQEFLVAREASDGGDINRKCQNIHHAVNIPDVFMEAVVEGKDWYFVDPHTKQIKGTTSARTLWMDILKMRMKTGEPYLHFIDASNRAMPQALKDKGLRISQSNLCVAPETPILTNYGHVAIGAIEGRTLEVWNGLDWSRVEVKKTAQNAELLRVEFNDGSFLDCTPEHKFYVQETYSSTPKAFPAKDLTPGMKLEKMDLPTSIFEGPTDFPDAYSHGFYCGDGNEDYEFSWVYAPKAEVIPFLSGKVTPEFDLYNRKRWDHGKFAYNKFFVPMINSFSRKSLISWLSGYLDADACVIESDNCQNVQVSSVNWNFLHGIKLVLQTLGVDSTLSHRRLAGMYDLPDNKGLGELKSYNCQAVWMLGINGTGLARLVELGLDCKRLDITQQKPQRAATRFLKVSRVVWTGRHSDTFCVTEPLRNKVVFNGILTGNCSEITLPTSPTRTATCFLSSLNLEMFEDWKDTSIVEDMVEMLDNVVEVYIRKAPPELWKAVASAKAERSIGLGMMGFHSYLQAKGIPFEGVIAAAANRRMFSHIHSKAIAHSKVLAKERGEAPDMEGTGERFSFISSIAPNASSSVLCNFTSPSIEPFNANIFVQKTRRGAFILKNKHLNEVLETKYGLKGEDLEKAWDKIQEDGGSVQDLLFMDAHDKDVFKTAFELDQRWIVEHAAQRQPYISQAQSVNLFFPLDITTQVLHTVHKEAWEKGLKTLYYVRSKSASQIKRTTISTSDCIACEG